MEESEMKRVLSIVLVIFISGCVSRYGSITTPEGHNLKFSIPSLGSKSKVKRISMKVDGVEIVVDGYESDTVSAFKAGVDAAVALKP